MIAVLLLEGVDVLAGCGGVEVALLLDDAVEGGIDVLGHAGSVSADVDAGTFLKPFPEVGGFFEHLVLHVDLVLLVAGEGQVEAGEVLVGDHGLEFIAVEEVGGGGALAEEEPVAASCGEGAALVKKGTEGSDAGAGTDHDDGGVGLFG